MSKLFSHSAWPSKLFSGLWALAAPGVRICGRVIPPPIGVHTFQVGRDTVDRKRDRDRGGEFFQKDR